MSTEEKRRVCLQALEAHKDGNWDKAHELIQHNNDPWSCWIHAMLHREEGDEFNANYWYQRANKSFCRLSIDEEREVIFRELEKAR